MSEFKYVAYLGSNKALSTAEFCEVYGCEIQKGLFASEFFFTNFSPEKEELFYTLGGILKLGRVLGAAKGYKNWQELFSSVLKQLPQNINPKAVNVNIYGNFNVRVSDIKVFAKEKLTEVLGKKVKLAGHIDHSKSNTATTLKVLNKDGIELDLIYIKAKNTLYISQTIKVQDIDFWSKMDYDRPYRDMKIGLMPSKLARIMLNLAKLQGKTPKGEDKGFWDPFCGLGTTIMQGQFLRLYSYGSDINRRAVEMATANVEWLYNEGFVKELRFNIFKHDIKKNPLSNKILRDVARFGKFDAVVTEPYLGQPRTKPFVSKRQAAAAWTKLKPLYKAFLRNVSPLIYPGARVVFIVPMFKLKEGSYYAPKPEINRNRWRVVDFGVGNLSWVRSSNMVARKIIVLEKK